MKVYIYPEFNRPDKGEGGIRRVVEAQLKYLPKYGVEIVDSPEEADVVNCHAVEYVDHDAVVLSCHGLYWVDNPLNNQDIGWPSWAIRANRRLVQNMKKARVVTTPSEWVSNALRRGMLLNPYTCQHGIEPDEWERGEPQGYVLWNKNRIDPICSPQEVTLLAKAIPSLNFVSTFATEDLENLKQLGRIPYSEMKEWVRGASIYLATARETGGIGTLEAMACGVPVLGWNWGGTAEIVDHKVTGYLAELGNYDDLVAGIDFCLSNWYELSDAAYEVSRNKYSWKNRIADYLPAYKKAMEDNAKEVNNPKVSVVITAYNLESYLPSAIESVIDQDADDWELIIVDDCSPDKCGEVADGYAKNDERIRVIHNQENAYLAQARNIGIQNSSGRYVIPLDADDELAPYALRALSEALDKDRDTDIVTGAMQLIEPDGRRWVSDWPIDEPSYDLQINHHNMVPYASMYRRWVWERTGGYRRRMKSAEDAEFWTRATSFGAIFNKVTERPTLIYNNRPSSMSHSIPTPDWTQWFTWAQFPHLTPSAASTDKISNPVKSYGPLLVSVIIPVGPGHDWYLQDTLDSLVAQTMTRWEAIVVNDTGISWYDDEGNLINNNLQGFPFVKIVENYSNKHSPAIARNLGIAESTTDLFVLLDADDYAQPELLELLFKTHREVGGWIYTDWYDQDGQHKEAKSWSLNIIKSMLGPVVGIYPKSGWEDVGGFDEKAPGWEDWDFQLSILEAGCCGSRLVYPGFTYRYLSGARREENFSNKDKILEYIKTKHKMLTEDDPMPCKKCGGGKSSITVISKMASQAGITVDEMDSQMEKVLVEYTGPAIQFQSRRSFVNPRVKYRFGGDKDSESRKFFAYAQDAKVFDSNKDFQLVDRRGATRAASLPPVHSDMKPAPVTNIPVDILDIDPKTISLLKDRGYTTIESLNVPDTEILAIKHIGEVRLNELRTAIADIT